MAKLHTWTSTLVPPCAARLQHPRTPAPQVGMIAFNIGLTYGFTSLGNQTGILLPAAYLTVRRSRVVPQLCGALAKNTTKTPPLLGPARDMRYWARLELAMHACLPGRVQPHTGLLKKPAAPVSAATVPMRWAGLGGQGQKRGVWRRRRLGGLAPHAAAAGVWPQCGGRALWGPYHVRLA